MKYTNSKAGKILESLSRRTRTSITEMYTGKDVKEVQERIYGLLGQVISDEISKESKYPVDVSRVFKSAELRMKPAIEALESLEKLVGFVQIVKSSGLSDDNKQTGNELINDYNDKIEAIDKLNDNVVKTNKFPVISVIIKGTQLGRK